MTASSLGNAGDVLLDPQEPGKSGAKSGLSMTRAIRDGKTGKQQTKGYETGNMYLGKNNGQVDMSVQIMAVMGEDGECYRKGSGYAVTVTVSGTRVIDVIEQGAGEHPDGPQIPVASDNDSCSSPDEDKLATFEKQLEDEYKVKSKAEKLIKAYSTGRSKDQKHLRDAQKILHDSKRKIEILRMLILQHKATPAISPLEKRIEELSHRFVIERAVAEGAKHAIQKLDGKPLVEAQSILQESNEKLDLLKYSLEERVKELPDGHHRKSITTEELSLGSVKSKFIALTGTLKVRVKGCHGILENVPGRLKDPSDVHPGRSPRRGRFLLLNWIRRNNRGSNQNIQETFDFSSTVIFILLIPLCTVTLKIWGIEPFPPTIVKLHIPPFTDRIYNPSPVTFDWSWLDKVCIGNLDPLTR
ncbi:serine threonine- kinase N2 isoform X2 [Pelobates cultripes]|uniref:Serine threonine- kinase N2 isoform X2 n=1 Tax=Pelobates cultripes TaxID=61616 RepID=A0AAD1TLR0_PELCU|nr:serine threonine- kinase N2 isoform X2 [Pelobates cultripes]